MIGADSLEYLTIDMLHDACQSCNNKNGFCDGCFTGNCPVKMDMKDFDKQFND